MSSRRVRQREMQIEPTNRRNIRKKGETSQIKVKHPQIKQTRVQKRGFELSEYGDRILAGGDTYDDHNDSI